jgi:hypothetical protein
MFSLNSNTVAEINNKFNSTSVYCYAMHRAARTQRTSSTSDLIVLSDLEGNDADEEDDFLSSSQVDTSSALNSGLTESQRLSCLLHDSVGKILPHEDCLHAHCHMWPLVDVPHWKNCIYEARRSAQNTLTNIRMQRWKNKSGNSKIKKVLGPHFKERTRSCVHVLR